MGIFWNILEYFDIMEYSKNTPEYYGIFQIILFHFILEYSRIFQNVTKYFKVFKYIQKHSNILDNILEYSRIFWNILE